MKSTWKALYRTIGATLFLTAFGVGAAQAQCTYPMTATFGLVDSFAPVPTDPIPYMPAFPQFVSWLNANGVPTANMKTFDDLTPNQWMVATLRHGLRGCFPNATQLLFCFHAQAHPDIPSNDTFAIFDTDFGVYSFPTVYNNTFATLNGGSWKSGTIQKFCVDLTPQMVSGQIGDMLQFAAQDDTAIDWITMILN